MELCSSIASQPQTQFPIAWLHFWPAKQLLLSKQNSCPWARWNSCSWASEIAAREQGEITIRGRAKRLLVGKQNSYLWARWNSCCWVATGAKSLSPFLGALSQITALGFNAKNCWIWIKKIHAIFSLSRPIKRGYHDQSECSDSDPNWVIFGTRFWPSKFWCKGGGPPVQSIHKPFHFVLGQYIIKLFFNIKFNTTLFNILFLDFIIYNYRSVLRS